MSASADALAERVFTAAIATFDITGIYLGDRLGYFRSLASSATETRHRSTARSTRRPSIEALHDMANPVPVLRAVRETLTGAGSLIVVDERVAEEFSAPDANERPWRDPRPFVVSLCRGVRR